MKSSRTLLILSWNNLLGAGSSYLATVLLARALGPEDFGFYSYVLVIGALTSIFLNYSTDTTAAASYAMNKNIGDIFSSIFTFRLSAFAAFLVIALLTSLYDASLAFGIVAVNLATLNLSFVFELSGRNVKYSAIQLIERLAFACLVVFLALAEFMRITPDGAFIIVFFVSVISLLAQASANAEYFRKFQMKFSWIGRIVKENVFLVLTALSTFAYGGISRILLESKLGQLQLGIYSAGWQFILVITIFTSQVSRVFRLKISEALIEMDVHALAATLREYILLSTLPVIIFALAFWLVGDDLVALLFGMEYSGVEVMIPWLSAYFVIINFDALGLIMWTAKGGRAQYFLISSLWSVVLLLVLFVLNSSSTLSHFISAVVICHGCSVTSLLMRFAFLYRRDLQISSSRT